MPSTLEGVAAYVPDVDELVTVVTEDHPLQLLPFVEVACCMM
jgi:hypothetical protein